MFWSVDSRVISYLRNICRSTHPPSTTIQVKLPRGLYVYKSAHCMFIKEQRTPITYLLYYSNQNSQKKHRTYLGMFRRSQSLLLSGELDVNQSSINFSTPSKNWLSVLLIILELLAIFSYQNANPDFRNVDAEM